MNKQSYLAELTKLLGFMSTWDRQAALEKYTRLFDEASDEAELIAQLGTPTKLAINLALEYTPTAAPVAEELPEEITGEAAKAEGVEPYGEALPVPVAEEEETPYGEAPAPRPRLRPFGLIVAILFGLVFGVPIAVILICVGIPFLALGAALAASAVLAVVHTVGLLAMVSDILVFVGAGLVLAALGLFVAWFGLWLSLELGYLWINGVVLRLGKVLSWKKEVAQV